MRRKVNAPGQSAGRDQHLNLLTHVQLFDELTVLLVEASMVETDSERQSQLQILIGHLTEPRVQLILGHVDPFLRRQVIGQERDELEGGQAGLTTRGHKDQRWLVGRVQRDLLETGLVHGGHSRTVELN